MTRVKPCRARMLSRAAVRCTLVVGLVSGCEPAAPDGAPVRGSESAHLPAGFELRLDRSNRDPADFVVTQREDGIGVRTGPAGILYRPDHSVESGDYTVTARFTEVGAPLGHREGFGLFVGGSGLSGPAQRYTYFLVRADGRYVVKARDGGATEELSDGWQPSESVRVAAMEDGDVTNELSVRYAAGRLSFVVNGAEVAELDAARVGAHGIVGVRVNHNLVVRVQDFEIER